MKKILFFSVTLITSSLIADSNVDTYSQDNNEKVHNHIEPSEMTTITINADPRDKSLLDSTDPISVMDSHEIKVKAATTLGETLSGQPGVNSSYFGPGASRPVIRGNAGERVKILKNGVGSLDISNTSEDHQVTINPLTTESLEVLRGPETLLYGSSGIGGVVNATDNTISKTPINEPIRGEYNLRTQTVNDEFSGSLKTEGGYKGFNWHISGLNQVTDDVRIPGYSESSRLRQQEANEGEEAGENKSILRDSATRTQTGTIGTSYAFEKGYVGLSLTGYGARYGVPGHAHSEIEGHDHEEDHHEEEEEEEEHTETEKSPAGVKIDLEQWRLDSRGELREITSNIERIKYSLGFSNYDHVELEGATAGTRFQNDAFEGRTELKHKKLGIFSGTIGAQLEASDFSALGEEAFLPDTKRYSPGVFIFEEVSLNDSNSLNLQFGGRVESVSLNPEGNNPDLDFIPVSLSSGLSWKIDKEEEYTSGLSFAYTERAPAATELYSNGIHAARQIAEFGDSNLDLESSVGLDLTFKKNKGIVTGQLNLFIQDYSNYINLSSTGQKFEGFDSYNYNQIDAIFTGFELESYLHLHDLFDYVDHQVDIGGTIDFVRARNPNAEVNSLANSSGENLPRIPPMRFMPQIRYGYQELFTTSIEGVLAAAQTDTAGNELGTSAYQLLNTTLEIYLPYLRKNNLTLYARGLNLTNEEARIHSSFLKDLAPLPGRSALIGINGSF